MKKNKTTENNNTNNDNDDDNKRYHRGIIKFNWDKYVNIYGKNKHGLFNTFVQIGSVNVLKQLLHFDEKEYKFGIY